MPGWDGGVVSEVDANASADDCVVAVMLVDCADTFPAASYAATV